MFEMMQSLRIPTFARGGTRLPVESRRVASRAARGIVCIAILLLSGCGLTTASTSGVTNQQTSNQPHSASPTSTIAKSLTATTVATATAKATATATPKPAATATSKPAQTATSRPAATATPKPSCDTGGAPANPWCYTFNNTGKTISSPPGNFCNYFNCIPSFWKSTNGYVEQCADSTFSHSGGRSGSCSSHGGNKRPLYQP